MSGKKAIIPPQNPQKMISDSHKITEKYKMSSNKKIFPAGKKIFQFFLCFAVRFTKNAEI